MDDLDGGDAVPDKTSFFEDGLSVSSFDTVRLSGCFAIDPSPVLVGTPEPDFPYLDRVAFDGIEVFALGFDFNQFGRLEINGLVRNNDSNTVDVQCRLTLISGMLVVESSFISVDDIARGETVPDSTTFLGDGINQDSVDRVRLSSCFTL